MKMPIEKKSEAWITCITVLVTLGLSYLALSQGLLESEGGKQFVQIIKWTTVPLVTAYVITRGVVKGVLANKP